MIPILDKNVGKKSNSKSKFPSTLSFQVQLEEYLSTVKSRMGTKLLFEDSCSNIGIRTIIPKSTLKTFTIHLYIIPKINSRHILHI